MKNVPFVSLRRQFSQFEESLVAKFRQVGKSGQYVFGQELEKFEKEIAQFCGTKFALGVGNGSDALFLVLKALDIGPGDEVIMFQFFYRYCMGYCGNWCNNQIC